MTSYAVDPRFPTANPGDIITKQPQSIEQKAQQVAVDKHDITGSHIQVPTYFVFTYPNGETKALHHVRDAKEISDLIRLMHLEEEDIKAEAAHSKHMNPLMIVIGLSILALLFMTSALLVGIF
jgi:hypothetical protein